MSIDQEESNESSDGMERNGEVSEDQGVEEIEVDDSLSHKEINLSSAITFGGLLRNGSGTEVAGYAAVNRGLNKFVSPKYFAMLLFSAHENKMPWITQVVPQKVMCNSVFVVDLKSLESESALFRDGLGSWIQNCGKVANYFTWEHDEVKHAFYLQEIKGPNPEGAVEFVRRIDKNSSCPAYTRVTVVSPQLGLAALQYFFKGEDEQTFQISYHRPKKSLAGLSPAGGATSSVSPTGGATTRTRSTVKRKNSGREDEDTADAVLSTHSVRTLPPRLNGQGKTTVSPVSGRGPPVGGAADISASSLIAYLKEHIKSDKDDRAEDRKLRREEMELRKKERLEEKQAQKEEIEVRKQELQLQKSKMALEQERWEVERKEKELLLELLTKKLVDG